MRQLRIGIDAGGDKPDESIRGAFLASKSERNMVVVYATKNQLAAVRQGILPNSYNEAYRSVIACDPDRAFRSALNDLGQGKLNALITATNSVKLMAETHYAGFWSKEEGYPGLLAPCPTRSEHRLSFLLDVGATARVTDPRIFLNWAKMGAEFLQRQYAIADPRVGLANIAVERAHSELAKIDAVLEAVPNYVGYAEPADFWAGRVDLLLMEGFVGNWTLKWTESLAPFQAGKIIAGIKDPLGQIEARGIAIKLLSYDEYLLSPVLTPSRRWLFRLHGRANAEEIAKACSLVSEKYDITNLTW